MESHNFTDANGPDAQLLESVTKQGYDNISKILRSIPGNDACAECGTPETDWASLNLGILMCIECSGVQRNLGVHISKLLAEKMPELLDFDKDLIHLEAASKDESGGLVLERSILLGCWFFA